MRRLLAVFGLIFGGGVLCLLAAGSAWAQPSNDDFDSATVIASLPFSDTVDMTNATLAADDPSNRCIGTEALGSVWYSFTPSVNTPVGLDTFGTGFLTSIALYTGSRGALTFLDCSSLGSNYLGFQAVAGVTYHIMVEDDIYYGPGLLQFHAQRGPTVTSFTINQAASVNTASGVATISGTIACDQNATATVSGTLRQRLTRFTVITGSYSLTTLCSPAGSPWSTTVIGDNGPFGGGRAGADGTATACLTDTFGFGIDIVCTFRSASQTVNLRGGH
jgi:hypothetical protein